MKNRRYPQSYEGFSLIELLVVIAVIAILAALIFPVFSSVREKSRQSTVISNYARISAALGRYQLDNGKAPEVLFAYAEAGKAMGGVKPASPKGLFPAYLNDPELFTDPNNSVTDKASTYVAKVNVLDADGKLMAEDRTFYKADAADIGPLVTGPNTMDVTKLVPRYQRAWTQISADPTAPPAGIPAAVYGRQLAFPTAPGETYVTCTTYHVQNANKVLVLFKSGSAKTLDTGRLIAPGADVADISATGADPDVVSAANFWKMTPTGN